MTAGRAQLVDVTVREGIEAPELVRLAASVDQGSPHVIAVALVDAARARGLTLEVPEDVREVAGAGVEGRVGGRAVVVGGWDFVRARVGDSVVPDVLTSAVDGHASVTAAVAVDGTLAGVLTFADAIRADAAKALAGLRAAGVVRVGLITGDRADVARDVGAALGVDDVASELTPADKLLAVRAAQARGPVMMVGDGVNDAPALAAANVGVAMGARGAAASSEAADVVILVDRLDRVATAVRIARRSMQIARQSVYVGLGLSIAAMVVAAVGWLPPVQGALLQEAIDVAVILNALRALR